MHLGTSLDECLLVFIVCTYCSAAEVVSITAKRNWIRKKQYWQHYSERISLLWSALSWVIVCRPCPGGSRNDGVTKMGAHCFKHAHGCRRALNFKTWMIHNLFLICWNGRKGGGQKSSRWAHGLTSGIFLSTSTENFFPLTQMFGIVINLIWSCCVGFTNGPGCCDIKSTMQAKPQTVQNL